MARPVPAAEFLATVASNVDNSQLSDAEFRQFIRNTLDIVEYNRYRRPIRFSTVNNYGKTRNNEDDVFTVAEFKEACAVYCFVDDDGWGYPMNDQGYADPTTLIKPSNLSAIPEDATHIVWYNR